TSKEIGGEQNMSGNIWMYSYDIDEQDIDMLQRDFITFKQGAEYYKMGMKPFIRICRESGAVYKIGKMVRVNRHILEQHIRKLRLKEEK
ncbi:Excisionase from transposon, partial [human gut metagenome]